jgi:hypothetical protein
MIIDTHTHMPGRSFTDIEGPEAKEFLELMDTYSIDQAWVFTLDGLFFDPQPHNDFLREFCDHEPERLIPFCTVHPRYPNAVEELRRAILDLGMKGVKMHPWTQAFSPMDRFMDPIGEVTGPGLYRLKSALPATVGVVDETKWSPMATAVGQLGWREYQAGRRDDLWKLLPRYYRASAAEEKAADRPT